MKFQFLLISIRNATRNQRGVTLMELIAVIALMTLVFGGIVTLLTSMYRSYEQTSIASENGRQATMIIQQLTQDIRKSVAPSEFGDEAVITDGENEKIIIVTEKEGWDAPQAVEYRYGGGKVVYATDQMEIELTPAGQILVAPLGEPLCQSASCYELIVVVGAGTEQVRLTAQVARYDWGEDFE